MGVQTLADLQDALDESLSWRRIELSVMAAEISRSERSSPDSPLARALARSGLAMLYAHWEGFTKDACQFYVDYVGVRRLKIGEISDGFALLVLRDLMRKDAVGDDEARSNLLDAVRRPEVARVRIPRRTAVNTKSNLRYDVLLDILDLVGVDGADVLTKKQLIDTSLCDGRNEIAHGRYVTLDYDKFENLRSEVLEMLEWLRDALMENARTGRYRIP